MNYVDLRNSDKGKHFVILGCGPSANRKMEIPDHIKIIGVNDSARFGHELSYHVLLDPIQRFTPERIDIINKTNCKYIFSQLPKSQIGKTKSELVPIKCNRLRGQLELESEIISSSYTSPFVGALIAYWLGAKTISFLGVDMKNHPNFNPRRINQVFGHTQSLILALHEANVLTFNLGGIDNMLGTITTTVNDIKSLEHVWSE